MERGKMSSTGRGGKSKVPQHPQDIFALGTKSTVVVSRDSEKRNIHKPSSSGVERKREPTTFGVQPPSKRARIGSPAEAVGGTSLEIDPVDLVPNVLQALDTHNSDKLLGLLTGSIRLLKSQRAKPDPILCMGMLYLTKIRPNMFAHEAVTQSLCTLLKREQGAAFKNKGNPLVFVLACNMLYAGHRESNNWPDTFIKVYIEDALNERWWVECSWCKSLVENIVTAFGTKKPPPHLIPSDNTLGTMSPSGSGSPLMGSNEDDLDITDLEYSVFPRYASSYEAVEGLVVEAIKDQIQRRSAAPDAFGKGFLKLLSATCGFPEIRSIAASRLEAWLHSGKLGRYAQELLAHVSCNCCAAGAAAARDHEVLAQLARMRLKTKPLQAAYQACLRYRADCCKEETAADADGKREMVSESPALLRSVVTHTIYNELSAVRSPNNMAVLAALIHAQPQQVPAAMADTFQEFLWRAEDYLRALRALTRECVRAARADAHALAALGPLARALAAPPSTPAPPDLAHGIRERAFLSLVDLFCCCCMVTASHSKHLPEYRQQLCMIQGAALGWLLDTAMPVYRPSRHDFQHALNKIMFVEPVETYTKVDNWPPESERALTYRLCCEAPLPQHTLLRVIFIGLSKETPVAPTEVFELVEQLVRRACALPPEDNPLQVDKLEVAEYIFQMCQFHPPENITLPAGYSPPALAITSLYWRGWVVLTLIAAHNPQLFAERAAATYPTLRALIELCITNSKQSIEWTTTADTERPETEKAAILQLETHLAAASNAKLPITEQTSRLLSQLTTLEPLGPARKPPQAIIDSLHGLNSAMRLGKLLCRHPALLLELVERHGTRRAMPWLHQLLRQEQLELSVLPVQCLCEFLCAGAGGEAGKAGELCAHLRRTVRASEAGARAVLHYYLQRLAHARAHSRAAAHRGLKLVLGQPEDSTEVDLNADVNPEQWLSALVALRPSAALRGEVAARVRAACLVDCVPRHLGAYLAFLATHVAAEPAADHSDIVLDLSQVVMERTSVVSGVLADPAALLHLTQILYSHLQLVRSGAIEPGAGSSAWGCGERVTLQWPSGRRATLNVLVAHAHIKLLCYGPSLYDTNQEMYSWLQSVWVGAEAPQAFAVDSDSEAVLLPDWLRLHLVRSARPALLEAGLRGLPAHKLALFIQTFGMPVASMSALLAALDACPAGAVVRLGVERAYMAQLLRVQRARGAEGGAAFAAALRLQPPHYPPDDALFAEEELPQEPEDDWGSIPETKPLPLDQVPALLATAFGGATNFNGDLDTSFTELLALVTQEACLGGGGYVQCVLEALRAMAGAGGGGAGAAGGGAAVGGGGAGAAGGAAGLLRRPAHAAALLRALAALQPDRQLNQVLSALAAQCAGAGGVVAGAGGVVAGAGGVVAGAGGVVAGMLRALQRAPLARAAPAAASAPPAGAGADHLITALESATPSTLEAIGNKIIETQDTGLVVDVITHILEKNQQGHYESKIKTEGGAEGPVHVFAQRGLGCGLLLDWLSELQRETLGPPSQRQMQLMFVAGGAAWRPLLVTLLAHRASWRTLHCCLHALLHTHRGWSPSAVLEFAQTVMTSPRVWQGRDKATPKHHVPDDTLRLTHQQLGVLVRYVVAEGEEAGDEEGVRQRIEARLAMVLRCCSSPAALLACALAARDHPVMLMLLYMKVPKILQLVEGSCGLGAGRLRLQGAGALASCTSATDRVAHTLLTALHHHQPHHKDLHHKVWRLEAGARGVFARVQGAGARALALAGALLRGPPPHARLHLHLLAALEVLPDGDLFAHAHCEEMHGILDCLIQTVRAQGGGGACALAHRVSALLRRYQAARPHRAAALLHAHKDTVAAVPALSALQGEAAPPASAAPPPLALLALQRRADTADALHWALQEVEAWGTRRGGAWGGARAADALLRAAAPLAASAHGPLRAAALALLAKLLPAVPDTTPGLHAILECLESSLPEVAASAVERLPELVAGMQEHAARLLACVFQLGVRSRLPVEHCLAKCVATINLQRGC